jgi:phage terminase small subunit
VTNPAPKKKRTKAKRPAMSQREIRFCVAYFEGGNASEAYRKAGFPERPATSTWVLACRLLRKPAVQAYIWELRSQACSAAQVNANRVTEGLARIAFANRADLFDKHGCLLPADQWPPDVVAAVEGIDVDEILEVVSEPGKPKRRELRGYTRKVRTAKRVEALKLLAQILRMIGPDAGGGHSPPAPLVVGGQADPGAL